jgi:hypothetical protein
LLVEEGTMVYCLNLPVIEMADNNHSSIKWQKPILKQARTTALLTATPLLGYKRILCYHAKLQIAHAACTLVAYNYWYKKAPGIYSFENWLKKIET